MGYIRDNGKEYGNNLASMKRQAMVPSQWKASQENPENPDP